MNTGSRNFGFSSLIIATPFKSHVLSSNQGNVFEFTPTSIRLIISQLPISKPVLKSALPSHTIYSISLVPYHP